MADDDEQAPWEIALRTAELERRPERLLELKDADERIAALGELEAYHAVKSLGADGAGPLLALLGHEQIRALFDLDVWHGGRLALDDLLLWLGSFREVSIERLHAAAAALDLEALAVLFRRRLFIARKVRDDTGEGVPEWLLDPPDEILPLVETPDGRFIIAARVVDELDALEERDERIDEEARKSVLELVGELYKSADFETAAGVLRLAETDMSSDMEEHALRFRDARLEDLGFPPLARALEIYAGGEPEALDAEVPARPVEPDVRLPTPYLPPIAEGLFHEAMRAVRDPVIVRRIEAELLPLSNAALVAEGVEPGQLERIGATLRRVRANLELALEHGAPPERRLEVAQRRLEALPLRRLFAAGHALTARLAGRGRALVRRGDFALLDRPLALLDDADRSALAALTGRRPEYALEGPPRPFSRADELARSSAWLDELDAWGQVLGALGLREASVALGDRAIPADPLERSLGLLVATLGARAVLGEKVALSPLDAVALASLRAAGDAIDPGLAIARAAGKEALAELLRPRARRQLEALRAALAAVKPPFDLRFVGGAVLAK